VRITGGTWGSRRVEGPSRGSSLRPTPDALREQAFAILSPHLEGRPFLDLFAGTGMNALEALSRGAARALLVERHRDAVALIRRNLAAFAPESGRALVWPIDARAAIRRLAERAERFEIAWCDPPFAHWDDGVHALTRAHASGVLADGALVVLEVPPRREPAIAGFELVRELRGAVLLRAAADRA
jgi:16S rRNA (guanine966-N2)-methyltransferase